MQPADPRDEDDDRIDPLARLYLRLSLVNVLLIACITLFVLSLWRDTIDARSLLQTVSGRRCAPRIIRADVPVRLDAAGLRPPENAVKRGYLGDDGSQLPADVLTTAVDVLRGDHHTSMRLGDPSVLQPRTVHVLNLWAPWCTPCIDEMAGLKAMMARHVSSWSDTVAFVPIKVLDAANPRNSYAKHADVLPPSRVRLADRSSGDALASALRSDPDRVLYFGELPVTLVLDCNRRVRWAQFTQLGPAELADLEQTLDRLSAEALDTGPQSVCAKAWCGNGRCDKNESTIGSHACPEDCGEPSPARAPTIPTPIDPVPTIVAEPGPPPCPKDCARCDDGVCIARLQSSDSPRRPPPPVEDPFCGDHQCVPAIGENSYTCCQDCACEAPLRCQPATAGKHHCRADVQ